MNEYESAIMRFPAKPLDDIFRVLNEISQRATAGEDVTAPLITCHLASGDVTGCLVDVEGGSSTIVLCRTDAQGKTATHDVTYVQMGTIRAVTVHDATAYAEGLSFGAIMIPPGVKLPSALDIKRAAKNTADMLTASVGTPITLDVSSIKKGGDETSRYVLQRVIAQTGVALKHTTQSQDGRRAVLAGVKTIQFQEGTQIGASLSNNTLVVHAPLHVDALRTLSATAIRTVIESAL
jgi:hypothetical protein